MCHPDVSGVDKGDEVRIVRTHRGVQTGPGGFGLHTEEKIIYKKIKLKINIT